jgi:hypothetical protein
VTANSRQNNHRRADADRKRKDDVLLYLARLNDSSYQALSQQINGQLDIVDEASVHSLQEIEQELIELRRQREQMLERAYRDDKGRGVFMTKDESGAFYEDGTRVADGEFEQMKERLRGRPTWDEWESLRKDESNLQTERDQIHDLQEQGNELREDLGKGGISKEEAQQRMKEIEEAMPDRLRRNYEAFPAIPVVPGSSLPGVYFPQ